MDSGGQLLESPDPLPILLLPFGYIWVFPTYPYIIQVMDDEDWHLWWLGVNPLCPYAQNTSKSILVFILQAIQGGATDLSFFTNRRKYIMTIYIYTYIYKNRYI